MANAGDRLEISASKWNSLCELQSDLNRPNSGITSRLNRTRNRDSDCIEMVNNTSEGVRECEVVGFGSKFHDVDFTDRCDKSAFKRRPLLIAEDITQDHIDCCRWGVVTESNGVGCVIKVQVSGAAVFEYQTSTSSGSPGEDAGNKPKKYITPIVGQSCVEGSEKPTGGMLLEEEPEPTSGGEKVLVMARLSNCISCPDGFSPGEQVQGTVLSVTLPNQEGQVTLQNGSMFPFENKGEEELNPGEEIELYFNDCCELCSLGSGCEECEEIVYCCCGGDPIEPEEPSPGEEESPGETNDDEEGDGTDSGSSGGDEPTEDEPTEEPELTPRECIRATVESCEKLGGDIYFTEEECLENCVDLVWCCDESAGGCFEVEAGDCPTEEFSSESECNETCGMVWCCDESSGGCIQVMQGDCPTEEFSSESECNLTCNRMVWCCDESSGECIQVEEGTCPTEEFQSQVDCNLTCNNMVWCCDESAGECVEVEAGTCPTEEFGVKEDCDLTCMNDCCCFESENILSSDESGSTPPEIVNGNSASYSTFGGDSNIAVDVSVPDPLCFPRDAGQYTVTVSYNFTSTSTSPNFRGVVASAGGSFMGTTLTQSDSSGSTSIGGTFQFTFPASDNSNCGIGLSVAFSEIFDDFGSEFEAPVQGHQYQRIANPEACDSAAMIRQPNQALQSKPITGVGTELQKIFKSRGAPSCQRCSKLAKEMDTKGIKWCELNFETLVEKIFTNAKNMKGLRGAVISAIAKTADKSDVGRDALKNQIRNDLRKAISLSK